MDRRIRIFAVVLVGLFALLFLQLNNLQVRQASALSKSPLTPSPDQGQSVWYQDRGAIVTSDGVELAYSTKTSNGYLRKYPEGPLFADITGYYDVTQYAAPLGLEASYNNYLLVHPASAKNLREILTERTGTDTIETTISSKLQHVAAAALGGLEGGVIAIDIKTGAVLAMYSNPTYDPNQLSSYDTSAVAKYFSQLQALGGQSPLVNGVTLQTYHPGSTFKIVTTSAMYDNNETQLLNKVWPPITGTQIQGTNDILHNDDSEVCGGNLAMILAKSCDTAYALIGQQLGPQKLAKEANAFGFNTPPPIDLPAGEVSPANFPAAATFTANDPFTAYSAIGQGNVTETVLQNALVAAAIGDGGTMMTPHLLANVIDEDGHVVDTYRPHVWRQATSATTAAEVRTLMLGVVTSGTAANVGFPASLHVAAKTGTAESGLANCSSTWMTAMAPAGSGDTPQVAVAAVVPVQGAIGCSETGAEVAGPIVAKVLEAAVGSAS
jgi:penicillin-binding protein A